MANEPVIKQSRINGVQLAWFEHGERRDDAPTLLFVHATGFHGRVWDRIAEAFPNHHRIALEQRGHGRSESVPVTHWKTFGEDMAAFVDVLGVDNIVGIGHSMGAHALVDAAARVDLFSRLVLLDPTIAAPDAYAEAGEPPPWGDGLHPAARRKRTFASPDEMIERMIGKSDFHLFEPRILRDYCVHGLLPVESGDYELACPPEIEAHVYMASRSNGAIYDSVRSLDVPVTVVRAKLPDPDGPPGDFSSSPTWPGLVREFKHGNEIHLAECTHFIPMQMPDRVIDIISHALDEDAVDAG